MPPEVAAAIEYAEEVVAGTIPACLFVRLAAERFIDDLAAAEAGTSPWAFRPDLAAKPIRFASLLKNIKGPLAGKTLALSAWQKFIIANLFGWVERGTTTRRFRQAVIYVPRGNGKTTFAAPIMLWLAFLENEGGAECYAAAVTRDQARILWDTAAHMVRSSPQLQAKAGIQVNAHSIVQMRTASKFVPLSSDAKSLEGLSVAGCVLDEIGSHGSDAVYSAIQTATGKRKHPLVVSISTATGNNTGIGKQLWDYSAKVLRGDQTDDRLFAVLYTIDDDDDPWAEASWIKANPGWGSTVQPDAIRAIFAQARNNPSREAAAFTRHLNRWVGADEALFSSRAWRDCADPDLRIEDFAGRPVHVGVDLASRSDIASVALVFPEARAGKAFYTVFVRNYLNEDAVTDARNASYPGWAVEGRLILTPGNETDFGVIEADILDICGRYQVRDVAFDPWCAAGTMQRLAADGVPVVEFRMSVQNLSSPTLELGAAMGARRVAHDGDPVLAWAVGNVVGKEDRNGNVFPTKPRPDAKIDPAVATIMAIGRGMVAEETGKSPYDTRGLLVLG